MAEVVPMVRPNMHMGAIWRGEKTGWRAIHKVHFGGEEWPITLIEYQTPSGDYAEAVLEDWNKWVRRNNATYQGDVAGDPA